MKNPSALVILLVSALGILVMVSCQEKRKEVLQYYGSGEVSRRHTEVLGKKEGPMIDYYKDGAVKRERMFENDIQVDKSILYYPNGKVKEIQYYQEGKIHGGDTVFYESGKPQFLRNFDKGVLHGYVRKWDQEGVITYEAKFAHDTLVEVKGEAIHPDTLKNQ